MPEEVEKKEEKNLKHIYATYKEHEINEGKYTYMFRYLTISKGKSWNNISMFHVMLEYEV